MQPAKCRKCKCNQQNVENVLGGQIPPDRHRHLNARPAPARWRCAPPARRQRRVGVPLRPSESLPSPSALGLDPSPCRPRGECAGQAPGPRVEIGVGGNGSESITRTLVFVCIGKKAEILRRG